MIDNSDFNLDFIEEINIKNFKSIKDITLQLGRVNVIIGANGTGKTNFLEAIAMGAAASADKLDYEFLSNRIRVTDPEFMKSAFEENQDEDIFISFKANSMLYKYKLESKETKSWKQKLEKKISKEKLQESIDQVLLKNVKKDEKELRFLLDELVRTSFKYDLSFLSNKGFLEKFLIYTPEYSFLKKFEELGQITPLGLRGEGLFYTLKQILKKEDTTQIEIIKEHLRMLDWFDDFNIPRDLMSNESRISIKDKFLDPKFDFFDQKSANEGFLLLLFYLILFTSKNTPDFFAVDNIETGFNPKLCRTLMTTFAKLSSEHNKQVIFTTHNPAILDGLDLKDDQQRLFVVRRVRNGNTLIERVSHKPKSNKKLSELWMSGIIGGLPDNF